MQNCDCIQSVRPFLISDYLPLSLQPMMFNYLLLVLNIHKSFLDLFVSLILQSLNLR